MKDDPRDVGQRPYGERGPVLDEKRGLPACNPATRALAVLTEAVRVRDFWLLAGSFLFVV